MDELFGGLGWLIILLLGFIGRSLKKRLTEESKRPDIAVPDQALLDQKADDIFDQIIAVPEQREIIRNNKETKQGMEEKRLIRPEQSKKANLKKTAPRSKLIALKELTGEDVLLGVVFKEIIDHPRARKPYQPIYQTREVR